MRSRRLWPWIAIATLSAGAGACQAFLGFDLGKDDGTAASDGGTHDGASAGDAQRASTLSDSVEIIASGQAGPQGIAVDEESVYWANQSDGTIGAWEKSGGAARVFARGAISPAWVVLDVWSQQVFWNSDDLAGILTLPRNALPDASPVAITSNAPFLNGLGVDGNFVYWTSNSNGTWLFAVSKKSEKSDGNITFARDLGGRPGALSVTSAAVYWINPPNETVARFDKTTSSVSILAVQVKGLSAIAAEYKEDKYVYYADIASVYRVTSTASPDAGPPPFETIASGQDGPSSLALFGEHVYWVNAGSGLVVRAPKDGGTKDGGTVEIIAKEQGGVRSIAVDRSGVYFTRDIGGERGEVARVVFR